MRGYVMFRISYLLIILKVVPYELKLFMSIFLLTRFLWIKEMNTRRTTARIVEEDLSYAGVPP